MIVTFVRNDNPPPLPFWAIRDSNDSTIFLWTENDVIPFCVECLEETPARFIAAVLRSLNSPNYGFHERWITAKEGRNFPRFLHGESNCVCMQKRANFCIGRCRKGQ